MALHPQGLPDLRHSCLDLRRAHDAQPRHAAVLVLDERPRFDDSRFGEHRQSQADLDLLPGVAQHGDATLARRSRLGDQGIDHHRSQHISGSPGPGHLTKHADVLPGHEHAVVGGLLYPAQRLAGHRIDGQNEVWRDGAPLPRRDRIPVAHADALVGRVRDQVPPGGAGNSDQGFHPRALLGEHRGRNVPVGQAPIDVPAQRDAVEREYVVHQLPRRARLRLLEVHHRRVGRGQHGVAPSSRDTDARVAEHTLAADALGQHAKRRAVDAGYQFDRAAVAAGGDEACSGGGQQRIEAPRPGGGIECQ